MSTSGTPQSLTSLDGTFGFKAPGSNVDLETILREIQGMRISVVNGGNQSTAISLLGAGGATGSAHKITPTDTILGAYEFDVVSASGLASISHRGDVRCPSTGNVQFSGGATTGSFILLFWWDKTGYLAP